MPSIDSAGSGHRRAPLRKPRDPREEWRLQPPCEPIGRFERLRKCPWHEHRRAYERRLSMILLLIVVVLLLLLLGLWGYNRGR